MTYDSISSSDSKTKRNILKIMTLKDYFKHNAVTLVTMSEYLGIAYNYLWMIKDGKNIPSDDLAIKIEKFTKGEVTAAELRKKHEPLRCSHCGARLKGKK